MQTANMSAFALRFIAGEVFDGERYSTRRMIELSKPGTKILCSECQYCGDKYSFPIPNELLDTDPENPITKRYYCCCGDSELYREDITGKGVVSCDCFEEL